MASKKNKTYDKLERPYGAHLEREGDYNINPAGELSDDGGTSADGSGSINPLEGGEVAGTPVKSEQSFSDIWIDNKIRSKSWKPQKSGFMLDGERGYAEFSDIFISGSITVISGGTIGGWTIDSDAIYTGTKDSSAYTANAGDVTLFSDGTNASIHARNWYIDASGDFHTTSGDIGGWIIESGYLYNLQSGTPTSSPNDGLVLASGNEGIIVYENTEKRVELGYLSAGVYGLKAYADDGSTVIFEASDTQTLIGGFTFDDSFMYKLSSGTPTSSPNDGLIIDGGSTPTISVYENTEKRVELGNLSAGVFGLKVYDNDGSTVIFEASDTQVLMSGIPISSIPNSTATDISLLSATHDLVFSVASATQINWASGTITFSNGRTFSISSGNTSTMSALTYVYLDTASDTVLSKTTVRATAIGPNKMLVGIAQNQTTTASFIPFLGGKPLLDGEQLGALSVDTAQIAAAAIENAKIGLLAVDTAQIASLAVETAKINTLAVTNAKIDTMAAGKLTTDTLNSQRITLGITGGTGDVYIAGGTIDAAAWTATGGFILGLDDSDGDKEKFFIGDATTSVDWNVTKADTLTVKGTIAATSTIAAPLTREYFTGDALTVGQAVYLFFGDNTHVADLEAGSSNYFSITDAAQTGLDLTGDFSIELWVKIESQPATDTAYQIISKGSGSTKAYILGYADASGTKSITLNVHDGTSEDSLAVVHTLTTGTWMHIAITRDASASQFTLCKL